MSLIFGLSKYALVSLITEWLQDSFDFQALDCALTNRKGRLKWLEALQQYPGLFIRSFFNHAIPLSRIPDISHWCWIRSLNMIDFRNVSVQSQDFANIKTFSFPSINSFECHISRIKVISKPNSLYRKSDSIDWLCLVEKCSSLESLTVCVDDDTEYPFKRNVSMIANWSRLRVFKVVGPIGFDDSFVCLLLSSCSHLTEFHHPLSMQTLSCLIVHGRSIERLFVVFKCHQRMPLNILAVHFGCRLLEFDVTHQAATEVKLLCRYSRLTVLNLCTRGFFFDGHLRRLVQCCSALTHLNLAGCSVLSGYQAVPQHLPLLKSLTMGKVSLDAEVFNSICASCSQLTELSLISEYDSMLQVDKAALRNLHHLTAMKLENFYLTDSDLIASLPSLTRLTLLELSYNSNLTDASLSLIGLHCRKLVTLHLNEVKLIGDLTLINITLYCYQLTTLQINISEASECVLLQLVSSLNTVKVLLLFDCSNMTDLVLEALAMSCSRLETMALTVCGWGVTWLGISEMYGILTGKRLKSAAVTYQVEGQAAVCKYDLYDYRH